MRHFRLQSGIVTAIGWHKKFSVIQFSWAETVIYVKSKTDNDATQTI